MGFIKSLIKGQDLFGYTVDLNFNKKGHRHNTIIGGIVSIMVKIVMVFYIAFLTNKMMGFKENIIEHVNMKQQFD